MSFSSAPLVLDTVELPIYTCTSTGGAIVHGLTFSNTSSSTILVNVYYTPAGTSSIKVPLAVLNISPYSVYPWPKPIDLSANELLSAKASSISSITATYSVYTQVNPVVQGFTPKGTWGISNAYAINDIVSYAYTINNTNQIAAYIAIKANIGQEPPISTSNWMPLATSSNISVTAGYGLVGGTANMVSPTATFSISPTVVTTNIPQSITAYKAITLPSLVTGVNIVDQKGGFSWANDGVGAPGVAITGKYFVPDMEVYQTDAEGSPISYKPDWLVSVSSNQNLINKTITSSNIVGTTLVSGVLKFDTGGTVQIKGYTETVKINPTPSNYFTIDPSLGTVQRITLNGTTNIISLPTPALSLGKSFLLFVLMSVVNGSITWSVTGGGSVKYSTTNGLPTPSTNPGYQDLYSFTCDGLNWYGVQCEKGY